MSENTTAIHAASSNTMSPTMLGTYYFKFVFNSILNHIKLMGLDGFFKFLYLIKLIKKYKKINFKPYLI